MEASQDQVEGRALAFSGASAQICSHKPRRSPAESTRIFCGNAVGQRNSGSRILRTNTAAESLQPLRPAGILVKLHSAPMYFLPERQGALSGRAARDLARRSSRIERKKQQQVQVRLGLSSSSTARSRKSSRQLREQLLYKPDRNRAETPGA